MICQWGINRAVRANSGPFHRANSGPSAGPIAGHLPLHGPDETAEGAFPRSSDCMQLSFLNSP